jgi:hypothetical protein
VWGPTVVLGPISQSTFLGQRREDLFSLFAEIVFREEKESDTLQVQI